MINEKEFENYSVFSVALTKSVADELTYHFRNQKEEDLTFGLWVPSEGSKRFTAIIPKIIFPKDGDRNIHGNASFNSQYVSRILKEIPEKHGIVFMHSHLGPGWQDMSFDDIKAEHDVLAGTVSSVTNLPLLGMTRGTDGSWSARFWLKNGVKKYKRVWADNVRVVGKSLGLTYYPKKIISTKDNPSQIATQSVWGKKNQILLGNIRVGIIGLGSVGSIVAECLSRIGISNITLIDPQKIETRNLDRTLGAVKEDVENNLSKVDISKRLITKTHTSETFCADTLEKNVVSKEGIKMALDCDVLFSCVDRPWPRHTLNALSYSHLIPVIDGGIIAKTKNDLPLHIDWRIHTVGPEQKCLVCLNALKHGEISLDRDGKLDDPEYIKNLDEESKHLVTRENVFAFSMSLASHEVLQFVRLITSLERVGGIGPQFYHAYPGCMEVKESERCNNGCEYDNLTATAANMEQNILEK